MWIFSAQDSDLAPLFGDWNQNERPSEIKTPLDQLNLGVSFKLQGASGVTKKTRLHPCP